MNGKTQLLSTAILDHPLINKAAGNGIKLDCVPFIQINISNDKALLVETEELCVRPLVAVFTSVNAVRAISRLVYVAKPDWNIYCIGNATKNALLDYFHVSAIRGWANDAASLAEVMLNNGVNEVVFFCGDKRMDMLPQKLRENQVLVHEVVVYQTVETAQVISKEYDGILFFSPSGVNSFFSVNKVETNTILFAIGDTTAEAVKLWTDNVLVVSETPSKENLVNLAIQYFNKQAMIAVKD